MMTTDSGSGSGSGSPMREKFAKHANYLNELVYPRKIYAFGLIAWTGNDVLNRRLRILADSKGYKLDDTGLFLATPSTSGKQGMKSSTSLSFQTEKEVFDFLGFPWLEPQERNL